MPWIEIRILLKQASILRLPSLVSRPADDAETIRKRALASLSGMTAGAFDAAPGDQCRWCDFVAFCEPGARFLRERPSGH